MLVDEFHRKLYAIAQAKKNEATWYTDNRGDHEHYTPKEMDDLSTSLWNEVADLEAAANYMVQCWHDRETLSKALGRVGSLVNNIDLR